MAVALQGVTAFRSSTLADDLRTISVFFGIEPTSHDMERLTKTGSSSLARALHGDAKGLRELRHVAVLAAFCRESEALLEELTSKPADSTSMRRWLYAGCVENSRGELILPIEALSDREEARYLLESIRREAATP